MLTTRDTIALLQASALDERRLGPSARESLGDDITRAWSERALEADGTLDGYLAARDLDREALSGLLTGAPWSPRRHTGAWIGNVAGWLTHPADEPWRPSRPLAIENAILTDLPFPSFLAPIVSAQRSFLATLSGLPEAARVDLLDGLAETLAALALRSLLTEMAGDASAGAYARLDASLSHPAARVSFLSRYPLLARDLVAAIDNWRQRVRLIVERLDHDSEALSAAGLPGLGLVAVSRVRFAGDAHNRGQSVAIVTFDDGRRLVYKPRDCTVFALYRDITAVLADVLPTEARLHAPLVVVGEGYGWVEFIEHAGPGEADLRDHLRRLGGLLAIAHALGASDLHLENVIASAAGPVPVDLETLVQNRSHRDVAETAATAAGRQLNESVLGTGILPVQLTAGEATSIDVSVVTGGLERTGRTATAHQLTGAFTDGMRIEAVELPIGSSQNQPPEMTARDVRRHRDALADGFVATSQALIARRDRIVGILSGVPELTVRHIVRATRSYSLLLAEMRQPSRLRSGIDRDHLLRSLWTRLADHPEDVPLIRAEDRALRRLDVPLFTVGMDSLSLDDDRGPLVPRYFTRTMREDVVARLKRLGPSDIDAGESLILESILAATTAETEGEGGPGSVGGSPLRRTGIRALAEQQARLLADTAIRGRDDATWISVCSSVDSTGLEYRPVGPTLYDGLAGIVLGAAAAHRTFPRLGLDDLAARGAHAIAAILDDWTAEQVTLPVGAFSGAAGLLYALSRYESLLGREEFRSTRARAVRRMADAAEADDYLDIMAGSAGALAVLTAIPGAVDAETAAAVRALARHLIDRAVETSDGALAWESGAARARLGGFSHGATGIGWALAAASATLSDREIAEAAQRALSFDDDLFDVKRERWLDARPESLAQGRLFPAHWCHGTAGIALARADAAALLGDEALLPLADIGACETAADLPFDDSLCHGSLGNLMALRGIESRGGPAADDYARRVVSRIDRDGPHSGLPPGITTVRGLMVGTAGTLYALCRELDPDLPNVLLLG